MLHFSYSDYNVLLILSSLCQSFVCKFIQLCVRFTNHHNKHIIKRLIFTNTKKCMKIFHTGKKIKFVNMQKYFSWLFFAQALPK